MTSREAAFQLPRPRPRKSMFTAPPSKRRKTESKTEEISFDFDKRADYLTGFHKRKVARAKAAQEQAKKMEREEKIVQRRQLREERKQELEAHVEAVNNILANSDVPGLVIDEDSDSDVWDGIHDDPAPVLEPIDREEEYIDEDKYTTVTVESVDISKHGLHRTLGDDEEDEETIEGKKKAEQARKLKEEASKKKVWPKKEKKKKFRYESKAERKFTRMKQKSGNKSKADARRE